MNRSAELQLGAVRRAPNAPTWRSALQSREQFGQGARNTATMRPNHFARESHIDELARLVKMDPLVFRLRNLKDSRLRAVLETARICRPPARARRPSLGSRRR